MILFGLVLPRDNDDCSVVVGGCWGWHSDDIVNLFGWGACGHLEDVADLSSGASILFVVLRLFFAAGVMTLLICLGSHDIVGCCDFVDRPHHMSSFWGYCLDLVDGRSKVEEYSFGELWDYISHETEILQWRTECACEH